MSAPAWTPGPWVPTSDGHYVSPENDQTTILAIVSSFVRSVKKPAAEREANARLIAAAPDLVEAAIAALKFIDTMFEEFGVGGEEADALRAALTKAGAA